MSLLLPTGLLSGLRVLEIGHFIAAPFATRLLADFGADVIKIEPPRGDPVRDWGEQTNGQSIWWSMHGRNKRSVALDMKAAESREILLKLAETCDVVIENFRPGHLGKLGLGDDDLRKVNPRLIIVHISGYGQDGPYRNRAAFGVIGEAIGGLRYLCDKPESDGSPPIRVGVSIGDSVAGLYAAFGAMAALWHRNKGGNDGRGLTVDVALTESVLSLMEGMLPEYGALGLIKRPTGSAISTAAPSNAYPTSDSGWVLIAANSEPLFAKLAHLSGYPQWLDDPRFQGNRGRVQNAAVLDEMISQWTRRYSSDELIGLLNEADIPSSKVYTAQDCAADEQYQFRNAILKVEDPILGPVLQAGIFPHIPECPGTIRWTGPPIGAHTNEVLDEIYGNPPSYKNKAGDGR